MSVVLTVIIVVALIALFAIIATWILSHFLGNGVVMPDLPEAEKQATLQGNVRLLSMASSARWHLKP